jgi:hypothetical protein
MGLEDRYSNLRSKPGDVVNKSTVSNNSVLGSKPQDVKGKPSITSNSSLALKPLDVKVKPIGTSTLGSKPQIRDKFTGGILDKRSLFGANPIRSNFYIATSPQSSGGPSSAPIPTPTPPTPGIGSFSTAYSNAYDGAETSISAFSPAFSNAF